MELVNYILTRFYLLLSLYKFDTFMILSACIRKPDCMQHADVSETDFHSIKFWKNLYYQRKFNTNIREHTLKLAEKNCPYKNNIGPIELGDHKRAYISSKCTLRCS